MPKKKLVAEIPLDQNDDSDPFNFLGFGMVAYRDLMFAMIVLFTILSLIMASTMYYYSQYKGYGEGAKGYSKLSLGNLGYSSTQC